MNLTFRRLALALRMRLGAALLTFALILSAGLALNAWLPVKYTAEAAVMLDVRTADPIAGTPLQPLAVASYMATQADVLRSDLVLRRALQRAGLVADAELQARWQAATQGLGDPLSWLVEKVRKDLELAVSRDSNVITLRYSDAYAQRAAELLNAIVDAYIATTVELRNEGARHQDGFFEQRARSLRDAVQTAQAALSEHQRQAGIVAGDERMDVENHRLADLSSQLLAARTAVQNSANRIGLAQQRPQDMPEVMNHPLVAGLLAEHSRQQVRLQELESRLQAAHPSVVEARTSVDKLGQEIAAQMARVTAGMGVDRKAGEARVAQLEAAVQAQRAKVLDLKRDRERAEVLQRDLDNAVQAYSSVAKRSDSAKMDSQAALNNVSRLQTAMPPAQADQPRTLINLVVTLVLATLAAVAAAVSRELCDPRVRDGDDIELVLGHPLLGQLPDHGRERGPSDHWERLVAPQQHLNLGGHRHG